MWMPPRNRLLLPHHWDDRLVAAWSPGYQGPGGLNLRDQSGNRNVGTIDPSVTWDMNALSLDAVDGHIATPFTCTDLGNSNTISAWAYFNSHKNYNMIWSSGHNNFELYVAGSGVAQAYGNSRTLNTITSGITAGQWYHLAVVETASALAVYVNGKSMSGSGSPKATNAQPLDIGRRSGLASSYFDGFLDDIRIYSAALPPQEIAELWNGGERNAAYGIRRRRTVAPRAVTAAGLLPITQAYMRTRC